MKTTYKGDNEIVADFMGYQVIQESELAITRIYKTPHGEVNVYDLNFNSSWDWLLPAIGKANSIISEIKKTTTLLELLSVDKKIHGVVLLDQVHASLCFVDIQECYSSLVIFIKWYNTQNS